MLSELAKSALEYYDQGLTVIPCWPGTNNPSMVDWKPWVAKRPSRDVIENIWAANPDANIGIITGKEYIVVDIDSYKDENAIPVEEIVDTHPTDMIVKTPSGGTHLYYRMPDEEIRNRSRSDQHIDLRATGGIVVIPPSIRPEGRYKWYRDGEAGPKWPEFLFEKQEMGYEGAPTEKWVTDLLKGGMIDGDGRNSAAARLTGYFTSQGLPKDVIHQTLHLWNASHKQPLRIGELNTTIESVFRYKNAERQAHRQVITPTRQVERPFALIDHKEAMRKYTGREHRWLIEDWYPSNSVVMVVASPGQYKSWLAYDLAISIASGEPFLGEFEVKDPGPVFIVQQEDDPFMTMERIATIETTRLDLGQPPDTDPDEFAAKLPPDLPIKFHMDRNLKLRDLDSMYDLREQIKNHSPKLVIIDPLYSVADVQDYMSRIGEEMMRLKALRDEFGCSFMLIHHAKKESTGGRSDAWGSVFVDAAREGGWQIEKPHPETSPEWIRIRRHFKSGREYSPINLRFTIETTDEKLLYEVSVEDESAAEHEMIEENEEAEAEEWEESLEGKILNFCRNKARTFDEIWKRTNTNQILLRKELSMMVKEGSLTRENNKYIC